MVLVENGIEEDIIFFTSACDSRVTHAILYFFVPLVARGPSIAYARIEAFDQGEKNR